MSARSSDWRSGANPSGVALDAFSDVPRLAPINPLLPLCLRYPHREPRFYTTLRMFFPLLCLSLFLFLALLSQRSSLPPSLPLAQLPTSTRLRVLTASTPINTTLPATPSCRAGVPRGEGDRNGRRCSKLRCRERCRLTRCWIFIGLAAHPPTKKTSLFFFSSRDKSAMRSRDA